MRFPDSRSTLSIIAAFVLAMAVSAQPAQAQNYKFKVLHTFHGKDGNEPDAQLVRDQSGNLYGTTGEGGSNQCGNIGCGTAFKMDKNGKILWLHSFDGPHGSSPYAGLLLQKNGNLYGTTTLGGDTNCNAPYGCGEVFKLDKDGKATVLYGFKGHPTDGWEPTALLIEDSLGNLYGTTAMGGESDLGTVFKLNTRNKESILYNFKGPIGGGGDGAYPGEGVIRDTAGNLYGGTAEGGDDGKGTVFKVDSSGNESVLYSFSGGLDGAFETAVLVMDSTGNLYGTTSYGGYAGCGYQCGSVFELIGGVEETTLYTFCSLNNCEDGERPSAAPVVRDKQGNLYGTTIFGGKYTCTTNGLGCGVVFKLDTAGNETVIHDFTGGADGAFPAAGLLLDSSGVLYGTASQGGDLKCVQGNGQGCGVVFKITP
jgi:uncharacterized repeat protein (TIGR03803 family)